jgi:hypothetical protein
MVLRGLLVLLAAAVRAEHSLMETQEAVTAELVALWVLREALEQMGR